MKPPDIRRGIASNRPRQSGGVANIGRVARLRSNDHMLEDPRNRRAALEESRRKRVMIWSIVIGGVSAGILSLAFWLWIAPMMAPAPKDSGDQAMIEQSERIASKFPSPSAEEMVNMTIRVLAVRHASEVDALVARGDHSAEEVAAYFSTREERDGPVSQHQWLGSMDCGTLLIEAVLVISEKGDKMLHRTAFFTPDEMGVWKLDFDAFARTCVPSWEEVLNSNVPSAQVRVVANQDLYYNGYFGDDKEWISYALSTPDSDELVYGYCKRTGAIAEQMRSIFDDGEQRSRVTVEIRRVPGAGPRQFEITQVVAKDWIVRPANGS